MQKLPLIFVVAILCHCCLKVVVANFRDYNETRAVEYVKLAGAAYCSKESLANWSCAQCTVNVTDIRTCRSVMDDTRAFVGRWDDDCVISFEGTVSYHSMFTDLKIYTEHPSRVWSGCDKRCSVHAGYMETWLDLQPCLIHELETIGCEANKTALRVTGHSMGAGVSAIAMMSLEAQGWHVRESYNFGMPRTGNWQFAKTFSQQFAGRMWRLTHHKDIIVQVPYSGLNWTFLNSYEHVGQEVFYDGQVNQGYKLCQAAEDKNCSKQYWDVFRDDWNMTDHLHYLGVQLGEHGCTKKKPMAVASLDDEYLLKQQIAALTSDAKGTTNLMVVV